MSLIESAEKRISELNHIVQQLYVIETDTTTQLAKLAETKNFPAAENLYLAFIKQSGRVQKQAVRRINKIEAALTTLKTLV